MYFESTAFDPLWFIFAVGTIYTDPPALLTLIHKSLFSRYKKKFSSKYISLLKKSYNKFKDYYISADNLNLPDNYEKLYEEKYYSY